MSTYTPILMFGLMAFGLLGVYSIYLITTKGSRRRKAVFSLNTIKKRGLISTATYIKWYARLQKVAITRVPLKNIYRQISELSILDSLESRVLAVKTLVYSSALTTILVVAATVIFKSIFLTLVMLLYAMVIRETVINTQLDKLYFKMHYQLKNAVQALSQMYLQRSNVVDSLAEVRYEQLVARPMNEILSCLSSINVEERLDDFYASSPLKIVQTLAGICYATHDRGDARSPSGLSTFTEGLNMIIAEINLEIRRLTIQKTRFGTLKLVPVVAVFAIEPIKNYFTKQIPGTAMIYNGIYGYISTIVIMVISVVAFKVISSITRPMSVRYDDRDRFDRKMMDKKPLRNFIRTLQPLKPKSRRKIRKKLQMAMSRMTIDHIYFKKFYYSAAAFLFMFFVATTAIQSTKEFFKTSVQTFGMLGGPELTEDQVEQLLLVDTWFIENHSGMSEEEVLAKIRSIPNSNFTDREVTEQYERMQKKQETLAGLTFSWKVLLTAIVTAIAAWFVPDIVLKIRTKIIFSESQEDTLQLQTIIGIMMSTQIDTLELIDWLSRHSRVYKSVLIDAYHAYPHSPEKALNKLKAVANLDEFKHMVDKLQTTIQQVPLNEAFADIVSERAHIMVLRELAQVKTIETKRSAVSPLAMAPMVLAVGLLFVAPIFMLALQEFSNVLTQM